MQLHSVAAERLSGKQVKRCLAGLIALVLLLPVPVFAFTWVDAAWSITKTATGGAPLALVTSDTNAGTTGFVDMNFGTYNGTTNARSQVIATRRFQNLTAETLSVAHNYFSTLQDGDIGVQITFQRQNAAGSLVNQYVRVESANATTLRSILVNDPFTRGPLNPSIYLITINVVYEASKHWSNSNHHFGFSSF